jgi:putative tryptophan/tyrosine transport system substrate-binding protein
MILSFWILRMNIPRITEKWRHRCVHTILLFLVTLLLTLCHGLFSLHPVSADGPPKIVVLNSDAKIEHYTRAQDEFIQTIAYPVVSLDLEDAQWTMVKLEGYLYDQYPDIVYCIGTKAYLVANKIINEKTIIFSSIINWQRLPITPKTYGINNEIHTGMQLNLVKYLFPQMHKIGVLYSRKYMQQWIKEAEENARELNIDIVSRPITRGSTIVPQLKKMIGKIDAFWLISDPNVVFEKEILFEILKICDQQKIPVISYHRAFAECGAVLAVMVDPATIGRQSADIALEIIAKRNVGEKIQYPAGSNITVNLKKIKEYGTAHSEEALGIANFLIE